MTQTLKQVVVLCGGKGSRMGSLGERGPKGLVPLAGKPVLEHQLDVAEPLWLRGDHSAHRAPRRTHRVALRRACAVRQHGRGAVRQLRGMKLSFCREETPLGTAGTLKAIEKHLRDDFIVFYGDTIMGIDLERLSGFHVQNQAAATLVVHPNHHPHDSDLLDIDGAGRVVALYPKPRDASAVHRNLASAGLYVL